MVASLSLTIDEIDTIMMMVVVDYHDWCRYDSDDDDDDDNGDDDANNGGDDDDDANDDDLDDDDDYLKSNWLREH